MIEVEIRGPLNEEEFTNAINFFETNAKKTKEYEEIALFFNENKLLNLPGDTVRVKVKEKSSKLTFKTGKLGRENEIEIEIKKEQVGELLKILGNLGFKTVSMAPSLRRDYLFDSVTISLKEKCIIGKHFEMEILVDKKEDVEKAQQKLMKLSKKLNFNSWSESEYNEHKDKCWKNEKPKKIAEVNDFIDKFFDS